MATLRIQCVLWLAYLFPRGKRHEESGPLNYPGFFFPGAVSYVQEERIVVYQSKEGKERKAFDALEWLAAMCSHVPSEGLGIPIVLSSEGFYNTSTVEYYSFNSSSRVRLLSNFKARVDIAPRYRILVSQNEGWMVS